MFYLSCEEYYTDYLGDNCNNQCEECCGNKEIYVVKKDFEVATYSVLQKDIIKKGSSAILVTNKNKEAMVLPYKTIYIHDEDGINGISMYNGKGYEKLINTDILINEQEMYDSFGRLFFKFIIQ